MLPQDWSLGNHCSGLKGVRECHVLWEYSKTVFGDLREGRLLAIDERFWLWEGRLLEGRQSFE